MRNIFVKGVSLCVVFSCMLGGCSKNNNVDIVKNTVLDRYSDAISVGQALDNFIGCQAKTQKWTASETSNGAQVVEFTCDAQDMQELISSVKEYAEENMAKTMNNDPTLVAVASGVKNALDISKVQYRMRFTLSKDKQSSQISFAGFNYMWPDGKNTEDSHQEYPLLTRIYSNKTLKDELKIASYKNLSKAEKNSYAKNFVKLYGKALKSTPAAANSAAANPVDNSDSALNYCDEYDGVKEALWETEKEFISTELKERGVEGLDGKRFTIQAQETADSMGGPEFKCTGVASVLSGDSGKKFMSYNIAYSMFIDEGNIGIETNMRSNIQSDLPVVPQTNEVQEVDAESQKQQPEKQEQQQQLKEQEQQRQLKEQERQRQLKEQERQRRLKEQEQQHRLEKHERQQQKQRGTKLKDVFNALKSIKREGPVEVNPTD